MNIKTGILTFAAAGLIAGLTGCGSSATTAGSAAPSTVSQMSTLSSSPATSEPSTSIAPGAASSASAVATKPALITIKNFKFTIPASVAPGAKITVKNQDAQNHTVTSATKSIFDVTVVGGGTATFTAPTKPGSYMFACNFHANMMGTLVIK
jgi:plastocyanin